jgi:hypothetical protein
MPKTLLDYFDDFVTAFGLQLVSDERRWGDTWKKRPREGQEDRAFARFKDYKDQFDNTGTPIPWMKVAGEALICWVRDKYPDTYDKE